VSLNLFVELHDPVGQNHAFEALLRFELRGTSIDNFLESRRIDCVVFAVEVKRADQLFNLILGESGLKPLQANHKLLFVEAEGTADPRGLVFPLVEESLVGGRLLDNDRVDLDVGLVNPIVVSLFKDGVDQLLLGEAGLARLLGFHKSLRLLVGGCGLAFGA